MDHVPTDLFSTWQFAVPAAIVLWSIFLLRIRKEARDAKRYAERLARRISK